MTSSAGASAACMRLTGAQALVARACRPSRCAFAFGIVGGKLAPLLHALARRPASAMSACATRRTRPMMAAAVYRRLGPHRRGAGRDGAGRRSTWRPAPGVAFNNNLAALLITTNQHRAAAYPHGGMFMDLDTLALLAPLTKWNAVVHDPRRMPELVRRAFREALSGRPGPGAPRHSAGRAGGRVRVRRRRVRRSRRRATARSPGRARAARRMSHAAAGLLRAARAAADRRRRRRRRRAAPRQPCASWRALRAPVVPTQMALGVVADRQPALHRPRRPDRRRAVPQAFAQADVILASAAASRPGCGTSTGRWCGGITA